MPQIIELPRALFAATEQYRAAGQRVGLVPTMGALHEGHMSLVAAVRAAGATRVVLSIFVNPLQFGQNEDLAKYPRTFAEDLLRCERHGVDLVYAPQREGMYPGGFQSHVEVERVTLPFEGAARPTHFRGVTTVVCKLFNATGPCVAAFGRKDYQQWRTIQRMVDDLDLSVDVLGCPIARESDGLAMSSRNRYLNEDQRGRAAAIHRGLQAASRAFAAGLRERAELERLARAPIEAAFDAIDYVAVADAEDLTREGPTCGDSSVLLVAARLGSTRLIDNCRLGEECL
ncbi:MAG TPA: pantoate--beta-alanine ligase [Polyangiales bacterium]|nr:pantoate--beta-alanine ligase [Polyangiales bacterium]